MFWRRLATYLLRETTGLYLLGVSAFCLLLSIDFLTVWASYLLRFNASLGQVGRLMLFQLPYFLHLSLPIALVFAVLLATGRLAKDSELKAAYASGVLPLSLLGPLLVFGLGVSLLTLLNNGYLEPRARVASNEVVAVITERELPPLETQNDVSYALPDEGIFYAGRIRADRDNENLAHLSGVTVIGEDGSILNARSGVWDSLERTWTLQEVERLAPGGAPTLVERLTLPFTTRSDTQTTLIKPEELTLSRLRERIQNERAAGGNTRTLSFDFHRRIADAFSALVFVLVAGVLGLHLRGRSAGFGWTIVLLVGFYFLWTLSGNLFEERIFSPLLAAWATSAVVGVIGVILAALRLR